MSCTRLKTPETLIKHEWNKEKWLLKIINAKTVLWLEMNSTVVDSTSFNKICDFEMNLILFHKCAFIVCNPNNQRLKEAQK